MAVKSNAQSVMIIAFQAFISRSTHYRQRTVLFRYSRFRKAGPATAECQAGCDGKGRRTGLEVETSRDGYINDAETKEFLERESRRLCPEHKRRSGSRYRLNRWREQQMASGVKITYGDLVREYVRLNRPDVAHERAAQVCYINFLSDLSRAEKDAVRTDGVRAWAEVKKLDGPKTYQAWKQAKTRG